MKKLLPVIFSLFFSSCDWFSQGAQITVGYIDAFSGSRAVFGRSTRSGIEQAIQEFNKKGGVSGKKIKLVVYDDEGIAEKTKIAVDKMIRENPNMLATLGASSSTRSLVMAPVVQQNKIPMVISSSTHPKVTATGDHIFRVCFVDTLQGPAMANYIKNNLKLQRVAIIRDLSAQYSMSLSEFFKKRFISLGGEVVSDQSYRAGDIDFSKQLAAIKKANAQIIYVPGYFSEAYQILLQARAQGMSTPFAGADGWDSPELSNAFKNETIPLYYTTHFSPENQSEVYQAFKKRFLKKYQREPDAFSALGFDAANVLLSAIEKSKTLSREEVRLQVSQTKDFEGVTGSITLDKNRNAVKPVAILQTLAGRVSFVKYETPKEK